MTLLDLISSITLKDKVTVVKGSIDNILIDMKTADEIDDSRHFHNELAGLKVVSLEIGDLCDIIITVE